MFTRKTRVMSAILTVCMMISMLACIAIHVHAEDAFNAENTPKITEFTASTATAASAYVITSPDDMVYAATIANNDKLKDTTVYLAADINLSDNGTFVGFGAAQFNIDGQGHTISNWKNSIATQVALVMKGKTESIKNIRFYDCDLKTTNHSALVYGSHHTDGITNGSLTISNITAEKCDITTSSGQVAFILPNLQNRPATISDIIVRDCTLAASSDVNNLAIVVARIPVAQALNITSVYADNVTITGGKENCGVLVGNPDGGSTTPIIKNAVVSNCSITATASTGVLGRRLDYTEPILDNILIYNPTINAPTAYHVTGNVDWYNYGYSTNLYTSAVNYNYCLNTNDDATHADAPFKVITADQYTSGEQAYIMSNNATGKYAMFWKMENGKIVPTNEAGRTRKITLELATGEVVGTYYANVGSTVEVSYANDSTAVFSIKGDGSGKVEGNVVTVTENKDVVVEVAVTAHNFEGGEIAKADGTTHKIFCADEDCDGYKVVDCSVKTYAHKVVEGAHKHDGICVCGNVLATAECNVELLAAEGDVHTEACSVCDYSSNVPCVYTGWEHVISTELASAVHMGACACGDVAAVGCSFDEGVEIAVPGEGTCGEIKYTCEACTYSYIAKTAMLSNATLVFDFSNVEVGQEIKVTLKLNPGTYGVAGTQIELTYDPALTLKEDGIVDLDGFMVEPIVVEAGKIMIGVVGTSNVTEETGILELTFEAVNETGAYEFAATAYDGVIIDEEYNDSPIQISGASGVVNVVPRHVCDSAVLAPTSNNTHDVFCSDCGEKQGNVACTFGPWTHVGNTATHMKACPCGNTVEGVACNMRVVPSAMPGIGEVFQTTLSCNADCGHVQSKAWAMSGDIDNDGKITLIDIVVILQVIVEIRSLDSVQSALGNVYIADGVTDNGGLNIRDAVELLRYVMKK